MRETDASDRRSTRITLTEAGRRALERIAAEHESWLVELFGGVSPAGQEALYEQLGQLRVQLARPGPTHPNPAPKEKS